MEKVNSIALDKRDYETEEEFWNTVATQMRILADAGYTASIRYEDCDIYVIEFDWTREGWGNFIPWVNAEEYEKAMDALYAAEAEK